MKSSKPVLWRRLRLINVYGYIVAYIKSEWFTQQYSDFFDKTRKTLPKTTCIVISYDV